MRAVWSGEVGFGLVAIAVKLYAATRDLTPRFHYVHKRCGTQLQTVRRCPHCRIDVAWKDVGRGYEVSKGKFALFSNQELGALGDADAAEGIDIVQFIAPEDVDPSYVEKTYWVGPGGKSTRGYALLRDALAATERVALARVRIRTRTHLAALRPRDGRFALDILRFADELIPCKAVEVAKGPRVASSREMQLARHLITQMSADFEPTKHPDAYRKAVLHAVRAKVDADDVHAAKGDDEPATKPRAGKVIDLADMLARSLKSRTKRTRAPVAAKRASTPRRARRAAGAR